jgi:hypothetical protein
MPQNHRTTRLAGFLFVGLATLSACEAPPTDPMQASGSGGVASRSANSSADDIALAIARALAQPQLRARLLQEFRASPWVEHKLVLQEFVGTPTGQALVLAAAEALGESPSDLAARIASLPSLDFYVLGDANRRTWRGGAEIAVALTTDMRVLPTTAYTTTGSIPYGEARPGSGSGLVMILLHPAEPKGRRMNPQAAGIGSLIQDANDGQLAVQFIRELGNGQTVEYDLRQNAQGRWVTWPRDGSNESDAITIMSLPRDTSEWTPPPSYPTTYVQTIVVRMVCDMDCAAGNEFEFRARELGWSGGVLSQGTARITGVNSGNPTYTTWTGPMQPMIATSVNGDGRTIDVNVVETDGWPNPDDNFDPNPLLRYTSDKYQYFNIGDPRTPGVNCPPGWTGACTELSISFAW